MGNAPDRVEVLFKNAKRGSNRDFIKLSYYCIGRLIPLAFSLLADKDLTIKFSTEALLVGRKKIKEISSGKQFRKIISRTTILRSVSYIINNQLPTLTEKEVTELSKKINVKFSKIEQEFLKLPSKERVLFLFSKRFKMDVNALEKLCINIPEKEIKEVIDFAQIRLLTKIPLENKGEGNPEAEELKKILHVLNDTSISELIKEKEDVLNKYFDYLREPMERLFHKVEFDKEIIANLKSHIFEEIAHQKEESRKVHAKDVDKAKNIYEKYDAYERKLPLPKSKKRIIKIFINIFILVLIIIIVTTAVIKILNNPDVWMVSSGKGTINNELNIGSTVSTLQNEEKKIILKDAALIVIKGNSRIKLVEYSDEVSVFELNGGKIIFKTLNNVFSDVKTYIIKGSGIKVSTQYAHFMLTSNIGYQYSIKVIDGWLTVKTKQTGYCVNNYSLELNPSQKIIIPFLTTQTGKYINAVQTLSKNPKDNNAFNYILNNSEDVDALTLWHLLNIPNTAKKEKIIKKLNELLLLEVPVENSSEVISSEEKTSLLNFIKNDLLIRK